MKRRALKRRYGHSKGRRVVYTDADIKRLLFVPEGMSAWERTAHLKAAGKQRGYGGRTDNIVFLAKWLEREVGL